MTELRGILGWKVKRTSKGPRFYWELSCGHVMPVECWETNGLTGIKTPAVQGITVSCPVCFRNWERRTYRNGHAE